MRREDGDARPERQAADEATVTAARIRELRATTDRLAQRLDAVVDQVAHTRRLHTELAAAVSDDLAASLGALRQVVTEEVGRLRGEVDRLLAGRQEDEQPQNPPVDWATLPADAAAAQWAVLARWLGEVVVPTYELTRDELPDCWALHPAVVVELSWLRTAYVQAYLPRASPVLAADWHSRWRPAVLGRVHALTRECAPNRHVPRNGPPVTVDGQHGSETPRKQVAEPRCWWSFYIRACAQDLARRRARTLPGETAWTPTGQATTRGNGGAAHGKDRG